MKNGPSVWVNGKVFECLINVVYTIDVLMEKKKKNQKVKKVMTA